MSIFRGVSRISFHFDRFIHNSAQGRIQGGVFKTKWYLFNHPSKKTIILLSIERSKQIRIIQKFVQ